MDTLDLKNGNVSIFTKGITPGGRKFKLFVTFKGNVSEHLFKSSMRPKCDLDNTVYNADTLGIRLDLIDGPVSSWADLMRPEFKGKAAIH